MQGETTMKLTELFMAELEREAAATRRVLERVPEGRNDWKPHQRSMALGYLASLVAGMSGWIAFMVNLDELDINSPGGAEFRTKEVGTTRELLQCLDSGVADACRALKRTTDEHLLTPWKFVVSGHVAAEQPRHIMIRDAVFNHLAHHRGQLTVYLRLNEALVPAIYGPSADEGGF
jgi:uncharacterized damage-inducible protein DinB